MLYRILLRLNKKLIYFIEIVDDNDHMSRKIKKLTINNITFDIVSHHDKKWNVAAYIENSGMPSTHDLLRAHWLTRREVFSLIRRHMGIRK